MMNKFMIVGKVSVLSKDNPDYPGFYVAPLYEDGKVIPISLCKTKFSDIAQQALLDQLKNGMTVGVNGKIEATLFGIKLIAEKITIISKN